MVSGSRVDAGPVEVMTQNPLTTALLWLVAAWVLWRVLIGDRTL